MLLFGLACKAASKLPSVRGVPLEESVRLAKFSSACCPRAPSRVEQPALLRCSLQGFLLELLPWALPPPLFQGYLCQHFSVRGPHF